MLVVLLHAASLAIIYLHICKTKPKWCGPNSLKPAELQAPDPLKHSNQFVHMALKTGTLKSYIRTRASSDQLLIPQ